MSQLVDGGAKATLKWVRGAKRPAFFGAGLIRTIVSGQETVEEIID